MIYYPSLGNRDYPYISQRKDTAPERAWETLEILGEAYNFLCRQLRKVYKWSPDVMDKLELSRLNKIYNEAVEDAPKQNDFDDDF